MARYVRDLYAVDAVAAASAVIGAHVAGVGFDEAGRRFWDTAAPFGLLSVLIVAAWLLLQAIGGSYRHDVVGYGTEEYRRVIDVGVRSVALIAVVAFAFKIEVARGFVASLIPMAVVVTLLGRWWSRKWLHAQRRRGALLFGVVAVGNADSAHWLTRVLDEHPEAGHRVAGTIVLDTVDETAQIERVLALAQAASAAVVAITSDTNLSAHGMRMLSWRLADAGLQLLVTPQISDLAAPKVAVRPMAGIPLLQLEQPRLHGFAPFVKAIFDRTVALVALVVLSPLLAALAIAVKCTSQGPIIFSQPRLGRRGEWFTIFKFRTMYADAHAASLANEADGLLFKVRSDPRVTPLGERLRRYSLDELPQFWNVLKGDMSLVGPRPLPDAGTTDELELAARRRVMVKPGLTGLWQISGRSDLSWEESIRLDLYYVENWSLTLDAVIVIKTFAAVIRGTGAY